jgi:RNA polymerase sigma-70 factor (ECF subfamily)
MVDWEGIVERDGPAVWRTVYRLLGRRADAEDCFQETFLAALELWRREPVRHPRAALLRLATARAIDRLRWRYRQAGRETDAPFDGVAHAGDGPSERAAANELSQRLRQALTFLPDKQADVFCLYALEGWSYSEVAEQLRISVEAVGVLLHRGRAKLRVALAEWQPGAQARVSE